MAGGRSVLASTFRVAQILWLQITGVFFVFFALVTGIACWKEYQGWTTGKIGPGRAILALVVCGMFAWFGLSSFWRASRKP